MELKIYKKLATLLLCFVSTMAAAQQHTVNKKLTKDISLTGTQVLAVINRYGDIRVRQWSQKHTLVKISISGEANDAGKAALLAASVRVNERRLSDSIILETRIDTVVRKKITSNNGRCRINYEIYSGTSGRLCLNNSFGQVNAGNYNGRLEVVQQFGNFLAGKLTGSSIIRVDQGDMNIGWLENTRIEIRGFQMLHIGAVSGESSGHFSIGNKAEIALSPTLKKLTLEADNVNPLHLTGLKSTGVDLNVHTDASKLISNGQIQFRIEKAVPAKVDSTSTQQTDMLKLKKLKSDLAFKKANDYHLSYGTATVPVNLNVSFSVVKVED